MGLNPSDLRHNIRSKLPSGDPLSAAAAEKRAAQKDATVERKLHEKFADWLRINDLLAVHSRMDRKSTIMEGWPDFTVIYQGRVALIEFKAGGNILSAEQEAVIAMLAARGTPTKVCYDLMTAIEWAREQLGLEGPGPTPIGWKQRR